MATNGGLTLRIVDPLNLPDWDDLLLSNPDYTFFHTSRWARVLSEAYQYRPAYIAGMEGDRLSVLIPVMEINSLLTGKRGVSLPFSDYCDPIIPQDHFQEALRYLIQHGKREKWKTLEIRGGKHFSSETPPFAGYYIHTLSLMAGEERVFADFKSPTKRNIKKAVREEIEVRLECSLDAVNEFCRLNSLTRRDHGLPSQPFSFFRKIYDHVISKNQGYIVLASHHDKVIAGAVYFLIGEKGYYKYGASNKKFQHLRANNLVMWESIQHLIRKGYKSLCFGRTHPAHEGLRQFKLGWAPHEETIYYYKYDLREECFLSENGAEKSWPNTLFRRTPVPVLNLIGSLLYRHIG